jgi:hypothetical protein
MRDWGCSGDRVKARDKAQLGIHGIESDYVSRDRVRGVPV